MYDDFRFMTPDSKQPYDLLKYLYKQEEKELVKLVLDMLARANYQDGLLAATTPLTEEKNK